MSTKTNYIDIDPTGGTAYFLRDALGSENLGVTVVECAPRWCTQ